MRSDPYLHAVVRRVCIDRPIPTYEAFIRAADLGFAYGWQKRFLQHLQLGRPTRRWVLKSPDHVHSLEDLLAVFPDTLIVQTHRDPFEVLRSGGQLTEVLQGMFARMGDRDQFVAREARMLAEAMERIIRFRDAHPELVSDPLAVVRAIYRQLDIELTEETDERMQHFAGSRSRYKR